jgi:hypothetical protein
MLAPGMVRSAPKPLRPPAIGSGAGLGGGLAFGGAPAVGSGLGGGLAVGGVLPSRGRPIPLSGGPPFVPNLWVEKGVIWNTATNLVLGFTSYTAQTNFMSLCETSFPGLGLQSAPKSWNAGAFSAKDMPILVQQSKVLINNFLLLWPSLISMPFAASFLSTLPITIYGTPTSGSPALAPSTAQSFQALSPGGQQTFTAKYILFSPYGAKPDPGITESGASIFHDLVLFGWWYS